VLARQQTLLLAVMVRGKSLPRGKKKFKEKGGQSISLSSSHFIIKKLKKEAPFGALPFLPPFFYSNSDSLPPPGGRSKNITTIIIRHTPNYPRLVGLFNAHTPPMTMTSLQRQTSLMMAHPIATAMRSTGGRKSVVEEEAAAAASVQKMATAVVENGAGPEKA
jgi:hypothetical protein